MRQSEHLAQQIHTIKTGTQHRRGDYAPRGRIQGKQNVSQGFKIGPVTCAAHRHAYSPG